MGFLEKIYKKICWWQVIRGFVFRFDIYNGTEENKQIYNEGVYEYEFINAGTSIIVINDGLFLYPKLANIEPTRCVMSIRDHEKDNTTYSYKFIPLDYIAVTVTQVIGEVPMQVPRLIANPDVGIHYNRLIAKSKFKDLYLDNMKIIK